MKTTFTYLFYLLFFSLSLTYSSAQNLVVNPGFELNTGVPSGDNQLGTYCNNWNPQQSVDYKNSLGVPGSNYGLGYSYTTCGDFPIMNGNNCGNAFDGTCAIGCFAAVYSLSREVAHGILTTPLLTTSRYYVSFAVRNTKDSMAYQAGTDYSNAYSNHGILFSPGNLSGQDFDAWSAAQWANASNYLWYDPVPLKGSPNWTIKSFSFVPPVAGLDNISIGLMDRWATIIQLGFDGGGIGGYTMYDRIEVLQSPGITIEAKVQNQLCLGTNSGEIDLTVWGGQPPYQYDWDNDGTGDFDDPQDLTGLAPGTYSVTVRDNLLATETFVFIQDGNNPVYTNAGGSITINPSSNPPAGTLSPGYIVPISSQGECVNMNSTLPQGNIYTRTNLNKFQSGSANIAMGAANSPVTINVPVNAFTSANPTVTMGMIEEVCIDMGGCSYWNGAPIYLVPPGGGWPDRMTLIDIGWGTAGCWDTARFVPFPNSAVLSYDMNNAGYASYNGDVVAADGNDLLDHFIGWPTNGGWTLYISNNNFPSAPLSLNSWWITFGSPAITTGTNVTFNWAPSDFDSWFDDFWAEDPTICVADTAELPLEFFLTMTDENGCTTELKSLFTMDAPLSVELTNFSAICKADEVALYWSTATEDKSEAYIIQRSDDGKAYKDIATVKAVGSSAVPQSYKWTDKNPLDVDAYYRLKIKSLDGTEEYSGIEKTSCKGTWHAVAQTRQDQIRFIVRGKSGNVNVQMFTNTGQEVYQESFTTNATRTLNTADYAKGIYHLKFTGHDYEEVLKVVVD